MQYFMHPDMSLISLIQPEVHTKQIPTCVLAHLLVWKMLQGTY